MRIDWLSGCWINVIAKLRQNLHAKRLARRSIRRSRRFDHIEPLEQRRLLTTPTVASINRVESTPTDSTTVDWTVTFSESVTGVDPTDFTLVKTGTIGTELLQVTGSGSVYTLTANGITGSGTLSLKLVDNDSIKNSGNTALGGAGTVNGNFTGQTYTIDPVFPYVQSINRTSLSSDTVSATSVEFTVTFSEAVAGVDPTDFTLVRTGTIGTTLVQVSPVSTSVYAVTISGITGNGTLGLNLTDDNSIVDLAGNPLTSDFASASFATRTTFATGTSPSDEAVGDVNGDGNQDLVVTNSGNAAVLLGNGNGTFGTAKTLAVGGGPSSLALGDVNGDGKLDLVVTNKSDDSVSVLLGNGNGTFATQKTFATKNLPVSVVLGDVDADGKLDLIVVDKGPNKISVLLGNGNGTFAAQQTFNTASNPTSVAIGDVNGDNKADLVVANGGANSVSVLLGNGNGTFAAQQTFVTGTSPAFVTIGDVNEDGKPDLAVANFDDNTGGILLGNGNGTFAAQQTYATKSAPLSVTLADVTTDGILDLVVANSTDSQVSVLAGNGNGTFAAQQYFTAENSTSVAASDFNGDGRVDLIVTNSGSSSVSLLLGSGDGSLTGQVYTIDHVYPYVQSIARATPASSTTNASSVTFTATFSEPVTGVDPTDFTVAKSGTVGTTLVQVTSVSSSVYNITISGISGNGSIGLNLVDNNSIRDFAKNPLYDPSTNASFATQTTISAGSRPVSIAVGDVNGDGEVDLAFSNNQPDHISILLGNGDGSFGNLQTFSSSSGPLSLRLADINGDDFLDLIVVNFTGDNVSVLLGNGDGTFSARHNQGTGRYPASIAVADINGDGSLDALVPNQGDSNVSVLLGNGDGTFIKRTISGQVGPYSVALGDVNGDNKPDVVIGYPNLHLMSISLGNGDGTFAVAQTVSVANIFSVTLGDINADGKVDIALTGLPASTVSVLIGNGDGTFSDEQTFAVGSAPFSVVISDVTGDGKLDLVTVNSDSSNLSVLVGNGDGTFGNQQTFATGTKPRAIISSDFNGDGRPDLAIANTLSDTVSVLLANSNGNFIGQLYTIDPTALNVFPYVQSINRSSTDGDTTGASIVRFTVAFSESVTGVDSTDFTVIKTGTIGATQVQVTPDGSAVYIVTVTGITGTGTVGLNLVDNSSIKDQEGNPLVTHSSTVSFAPQATFATGQNTNSVTLGDVNGDGMLDIAVAIPPSVAVLRGNGDGTFLSKQTFAAGAGANSVTLGDINGDGNLDLIVVNKDDNNISVLLSNGNGTFASQANFAAGPNPISLTLSDVNGDRNPDIAVVNSSGSTVSVLIGNGNGTFAARTTCATGSAPFFVTTGDLNNDGNPDLVTANSNANTVSILLGNGNGTFSTQKTFAVGSNPFSLDLGDVNGDGILDLAVTNRLAKSVGVLIGNGDGSFSLQKTFATGNQPDSVKLSDLNGDGMLDLVTANAGSDTVSVLAGNGDGTFGAQQTFATGTSARMVAVGDLNGDGRLDLAVANFGPDRTVGVHLANGNGNFTGQYYTITSTTLGLSASTVTEGAIANYSFTATLSNPSVGDTTIVTDLGTIVIADGQTTGTLVIASGNTEDVYVDASSLTATIQSVTGSLADLMIGTFIATAIVDDTIDTTTVDLSGSTVLESDTANYTFTATLSHPSRGSTTINITLGDEVVRQKTSGGTVVLKSRTAKTDSTGAVTKTAITRGTIYSIVIPDGQTTGSIDLPSGNTEDVYTDGSELTATISRARAGNFEKVVVGVASATAVVNDTVNDATVDLSASTVTEGTATNYRFTATLSNPTDGDLTISTTQGEILISDGQSTGTLVIPVDNSDDVYKDPSSLTAVIISATGGNFENLVVGTANATAYVNDTIDSTSVDLSASTVLEAGVANFTFTATLSSPSQGDTTITTDKGQILISDGQTTGTLVIASGNKDDVYVDPSNLTATISTAVGGNFEKLFIGTASATARVNDTIDTTTVDLSASTVVEAGVANFTFKATLSSPSQGDTTITTDKGQIVISDGQTTGTLVIASDNTDDVYVDHSSLTATISTVAGGNFEKLVVGTASATAYVNDTINPTTVDLSASTVVEGAVANFTFTATLSDPTHGDLTISTEQGDIVITDGQTTGTLVIASGNTEDVYKDASSLTATIKSVTGGKFEKLVVGTSSATAYVNDTIDTSTVDLSASTVVEGTVANFTFTATLSDPTHGDLTISTDQGDIVIADGQTAGTLVVASGNTEDVYKDASSLTATIQAVTGGNFEKLVVGTSSATAYVIDTIDTTTVDLSASTVVEGTVANFTFTATLSNPTHGDLTISTDQGDIVIADGQTKGTLAIASGNTEDVYKDASSLIATIQSISGGKFETLVMGTSSATAYVNDTIDATTVDLSAARAGAKYQFTATLSNPSHGDTTIVTDQGIITITDGQTVGTLLLDSISTATISSATSGHFEKLEIRTATASVTVGAANRLVFLQAPPATFVAGVPLSTDVIVRVEDDFGNLVEGDNSLITLTLNSFLANSNESGETVLDFDDDDVNTGLGVFSNGTDVVQVQAVNGIARFSGLTVNTSGVHTLWATSPSLTTALDSQRFVAGYFTVTPAAATHLVLLQAPTVGAAGKQLAPSVKVVLEDRFGNIITDPSTVKFTLDHGTFKTGGSTYTSVTVNGMVINRSLIISTTGTYNITVSSGTLPTVSFPVTIVPAPVRLFITTQPPAEGTAGTALSNDVVVAVQDRYGNVDIADDSDVTLTLSSGVFANGSNSVTVAAANGIATFKNLVIATTKYNNLTASDGTLQRSVSTRILIRPGTPANVVFTQNPTTATAGVSLSSMKVKITDQYGNLITDPTPVTLTLGGGSLSTGATAVTVNSINGVATFSALKINKSGSYTIAASVGSVTSSSFGITVNPATAKKLAFLQGPPATGTTGVALSPAVVVAIQDSFGNIVTSDSSNVTLTLSGGTLSDGGTTVTVQAVNGVATFANLIINKPGSAYKLTASDSVTTLTKISSAKIIIS